MGVRFEMRPVIVDIRHINITTAIGMMMMDRSEAFFNDDYEKASSILLFLDNLAARWSVRCDPDKRSITFYCDAGKAVFVPASDGGIDIHYIVDQYTTITHWTVEQYCEITGDWYEENESEDRE